MMRCWYTRFMRSQMAMTGHRRSRNSVIKKRGTLRSIMYVNRVVDSLLLIIAPGRAFVAPIRL